jgi:hypothetical protein
MEKKGVAYFLQRNERLIQRYSASQNSHKGNNAHLYPKIDSSTVKAVPIDQAYGE